MTKTITKRAINIATEFFVAPAGRFPVDGDNNGERFRTDFLVPAFRDGAHVFVDMDGSEGYGSSFLEEAFGGLVRLCGFTASDLHQRLTLKSEEDESFIEEVWEYIDSAKADKRAL